MNEMHYRLALMTFAWLMTALGWWFCRCRVKELEKQLEQAKKDSKHWESMIDWQLWFPFYNR
jgi:hypothetical protein